MKCFKEITSKENSLIKLTSQLQGSAKARKENGLFVLEGLRICFDAFDNGIRFDKLIVSETAFKKYASEVEKLSEKAAECYKIPDNLFKKISDTTSPQGIIAMAQIPQNNTAFVKKNGRYIALENIADPSNLGAVSRTAEALGVSGIILSSNGGDPYSPKAFRASMGTLLRMPVIVLSDFSSQVKELGLKAYACVVDSDALPVTDIKFGDGTVLIIGNEANGITDETKAAANEKITIPMSGRAESLNAAVAAAITMWEMMK